MLNDRLYFDPIADDPANLAYWLASSSEECCDVDCQVTWAAERQENLKSLADLLQRTGVAQPELFNTEDYYTWNQRERDKLAPVF